MILDTVLMTVNIELITIMCRLVLGSAREFTRKKHLWIRIHHGYLGIISCIVYFFIRNDFFAIVGLALLLSDLAHHFIVLPLWVKDTEFP